MTGSPERSEGDVRLVSSWFGPVEPPDDPDFEPRRPRRKQHGQRRYYRSLARDAERFAVEPDGWYTIMHWHVDSQGMGNLSWRARRAHLAALFTMFERMLAELEAWEDPHQAWLSVDPLDSSYDAVYLHSHNPYGVTFPLSFDWVKWDVEVPERLRGYMTDPRWQLGRTSPTNFVVRLRPTETELDAAP